MQSADDAMPGYLPQSNDHALNALFRANVRRHFTEREVNEERHMAGSTDMGDLAHIMPVIQPSINGSRGTFHGNDYAIADKEISYLWKHTSSQEGGASTFSLIRLGGCEDAPPEQIEPGAPVHLPFQQFQPMHLTLDLPVAPFERQPCLHRRVIRAQPTGIASSFIASPPSARRDEDGVPVRVVHHGHVRAECRLEGRAMASVAVAGHPRVRRVDRAPIRDEKFGHYPVAPRGRLPVGVVSPRKGGVPEERDSALHLDLDVRLVIHTCGNI